MYLQHKINFFYNVSQHSVFITNSSPGCLVVECSAYPCAMLWVHPLAESYLTTVKVGTHCLPAKHSALKGRIEGKWC